MKDLAIAYSVKRQMKRGLPKLEETESDGEVQTPQSIVEAIRAKRLASKPEPVEAEDELLDLDFEEEEAQAAPAPESPLKARLADIMKARGVKI